jgi:hypothetical protein
MHQSEPEMKKNYSFLPLLSLVVLSVYEHDSTYNVEYINNEFKNEQIQIKKNRHENNCIERTKELAIFDCFNLISTMFSNISASNGLHDIETAKIVEQESFSATDRSNTKIISSSEYTDDVLTDTTTIRYFLNGTWINHTQKISSSEYMYGVRTDKTIFRYFFNDNWINQTQTLSSWKYIDDGWTEKIIYQSFLNGTWINHKQTISSSESIDNGWTEKIIYQSFLNDTWINIELKETQKIREGNLYTHHIIIYRPKYQSIVLPSEEWQEQSNFSLTFTPGNIKGRINMWDVSQGKLWLEYHHDENANGKIDEGELNFKSFENSRQKSVKYWDSNKGWVTYEENYIFDTDAEFNDFRLHSSYTTWQEYDTLNSMAGLITYTDCQIATLNDLNNNGIKDLKNESKGELHTIRRSSITYWDSTKNDWIIYSETQIWNPNQERFTGSSMDYYKTTTWQEYGMLYSPEVGAFVVGVIKVREGKKFVVRYPDHDNNLKTFEGVTEYHDYLETFRSESITFWDKEKGWVTTSFVTTNCL